MAISLRDWSKKDYAKKAEQLHALTRESCYSPLAFARLNEFSGRPL